MKRLILALMLVALSAFSISASSGAIAGEVRITIDISQQRMYVSVNGQKKHEWPVSTGRKGYRTPTGTFGPTRMHARYFSKKYRGSSMHHSIFFYGGYAIHATTDIKRLGRKASHGCVRLHPDNARRLFSLVKRNGTRSTRIRVRS